MRMKGVAFSFALPTGMDLCESRRSKVRLLIKHQYCGSHFLVKQFCVEITAVIWMRDASDPNSQFDNTKNDGRKYLFARILNGSSLIDAWLPRGYPPDAVCSASDHLYRTVFGPWKSQDCPSLSPTRVPWRVPFPSPPYRSWPSHPLTRYLLLRQISSRWRAAVISGSARRSAYAGTTRSISILHRTGHLCATPRHYSLRLLSKRAQ